MRRDLVEAAKRGDHEAFEVLATSAGDRLYALARLILRSADLAEDAVQEALVSAWQQLRRGFSRLKPEQRAVVVLHYYSGFSAAEIARALGIPEGTARSRLHYATEAMRAALHADARQPAVAHNGTM